MNNPRHVCPHLFERNCCPHEGCEHEDVRLPVLRAFGPASNSLFAAELKKRDPAAYAALRAEAVAKGLLAPTLKDLRKRFEEEQQK